MTAATNGPVCGNCGERTASDAITCPHCAVLLAAYQSPGGSESLIIVTPESPADVPPSQVPPPPGPSGPSPAVAQPTSSSPIGDALRRSHIEAQADLHYEAQFSPSVADELTAMASGDDELADMADGNDELSTMAGSGSTGSFEKTVNAELAGAKVVFADGTPVIEAADVEIIAPGDGDAEVIEHPAPPSKTTPPSPPRSPSARSERPTPADRGTAQRSRATTPVVEVSGQATTGQSSRSPQANPSRVPPSPSWQSIPGGKQQWWPQDKARPELGKMVGPLMAIPFLLIICVVLGAGRGIGGFLFISLITMVVIVFLLVRAARLAVRKTTSMPRDGGQQR